MSGTRTSIGGLAYLVLAFTLGASFSYAAVQGDFGIFRRVQINAEAETLRQEKSALQAELARLQNLNQRLSDSYLDLDLLDQQARAVLGYLRPEEVVIR